MKYQATVSFTGSITMSQNEIRDIPNTVAKTLVACGYLSELEPKKEVKKPATKPKTSVINLGFKDASPLEQISSKK